MTQFAFNFRGPNKNPAIHHFRKMLEILDYSELHILDGHERRARVGFRINTKTRTVEGYNHRYPGSLGLHGAEGALTFGEEARTVELTNDYEAQVSKDGIRCDGLFVTHERLKEIWEASQALR